MNKTLLNISLGLLIAAFGLINHAHANEQIINDLFKATNAATSEHVRETLLTELKKAINENIKKHTKDRTDTSIEIIDITNEGTLVYKIQNLSFDLNPDLMHSAIIEVSQGSEFKSMCATQKTCFVAVTGNMILNSTASMAPLNGGGSGGSSAEPLSLGDTIDAAQQHDTSTSSGWRIPGDVSSVFPTGPIADLGNLDDDPENLPPIEPDPNIPLFNPPEASGEFRFRYYSDYDEVSDTSRRGVSWGNIPNSP